MAKTPAKQQDSKDIAYPVRHFTYERASESFVITHPADNSQIVIPSLKKLFENAGCVHPGKFFARLDDGSKLCANKTHVYSNRYGNHEYTISNREAGWMIHGRKGEGGNIMMSEDESLRGQNSLHLINPDTYHFNLFDLKNKAQFSFSAVILDHPGLKRREQFEANVVEGGALSGMQHGYGWVSAANLPKIEAGFIADFEAKYDRSQEITQKAFYSQPLTIYSREYGSPSINGEVVLSKGDVRKGEPLLTLETYWAPLIEDYYGTHSHVTVDTLYDAPAEKIEFYGVGPTDQPVMEREHVSLYRTLGGIAIVDSKAQEHYYILGDNEGRGRAYIRTVDNLADLPVQDIPGSFEICSLEAPANFDLDANGAQCPMPGAVRHLRQYMIGFDSQENQRLLLNTAYRGGMPQAAKLSRPEKRNPSREVAQDDVDISALTHIQPPRFE